MISLKRLEDRATAAETRGQPGGVVSLSFVEVKALVKAIRGLAQDHAEEFALGEPADCEEVLRGFGLTDREEA